METIKTKILKEKGYWLSGNFKEELLGDIKEVPELDVSKGTMTILERTTTDKEIMDKIGISTREEILATLITLTQKQKNGEEGVLNTNGYGNIIGYFKDKSGAVLGAYAYWSSGCEEWNCSGYGLSGGWSAGRGFWSRNGEPQTLKSSDTLVLCSLDTFEKADNLAMEFCEVWGDGKAKCVRELRNLIMKNYGNK